MEINFPLEFLVFGTPVSHQAKRAEAREEWKNRIVVASSEVLPENHFAVECPLSLKIYFFPEVELHGDLDNLAKPILDALSKHIYIDDHQIHQLQVLKFAPNMVHTFTEPTQTLLNALKSETSVVYVLVSDKPYEGL